MAEGLARQIAPDVVAGSAGTDPGTGMNALSVASLAELGIDIGGHVPRPVTDELVAAADLVVVLGRDARVAPSDGTPVVVWDTDEPSTRGIEGAERMRLVRDDIARHVRDLLG